MPGAGSDGSGHGVAPTFAHSAMPIRHKDDGRGLLKTAYLIQGGLPPGDTRTATLPRSETFANALTGSWHAVEIDLSEMDA